MSFARLVRDERGQVAPLMAVMLIGLVAILGLVIDGSLLFAARRDLQGVADAAARTGAMAVDESTLRGDGDVVNLDPESARSRVMSYLASVQFTGRSQVTVDINRVEVILEAERRTLVMGIAGIGSSTVRASSSATPRSGIDSPGSSP